MSLGQDLSHIINDQVIRDMFASKEEKIECTCREDQKQRALCPVCDKEEYDKLNDIPEKAIQKL